MDAEITPEKVIEGSLDEEDLGLNEGLQSTKEAAEELAPHLEISESGNLFPLIPLVADEDSSYLRTTLLKPDENGNCGYSSLVDSILKAVTNNVSCRSLSCGDVLQAIDRGGRSAHDFGSKPTTYWVLDPIDGTRGTLRGTESL
ncbi:putative PAP-specific phosphatase [Nymphaea thermarum]|nr:putative PAP-specific phosphatase [Nymphaea thermarum]